MNKIFVFLCAIAFCVACNNDKPAGSTELSDEKKAYYDEHGHDHNGNHDHNHDATKPEAVENNTRTRVPVERKTKTQFNEPENNPYKTKDQMRLDAKEKVQRGTRTVPDACTLITDKQIASVVGVDAMAINIKDGSSSASPYARSCFFRWDHRGVPNSGVLIQVQDNPVPDEFPEWAAYFIQAKKNQGEKSPDGSLDFKYEDFTGLGLAGAYSYELHRYMWRDEADFVYMVAFNLPASEAEELDWARKLGAIVMDNVK